MSKMKVYPGMSFAINKSSAHVYEERHRRAVTVLTAARGFCSGRTRACTHILPVVTSYRPIQEGH